MSEEATEVQSIDWRRCFQFLEILRSFRMAIHPANLILCFVGLAASFGLAVLVDQLPAPVGHTEEQIYGRSFFEHLYLISTTTLWGDWSLPYVEGRTWDDFLADALAIRDEDAGIFGYVPTLDTYDPLLFIYEHGGRLLDDLQNPTRTTFDDPLTVDALEWYVNLMYESNVAPTPEQVRKAFGGTGFAVYRGIMQGKAGMWAGLLSQRGGSSRTVKWNMRWGMVPLPRDAKAVTGTLVHGYFISAETQHPDTAGHVPHPVVQHRVPAQLRNPVRSVPGRPRPLVFRVTHLPEHRARGSARDSGDTQPQQTRGKPDGVPRRVILAGQLVGQRDDDPLSDGDSIPVRLDDILRRRLRRNLKGCGEDARCERYYGNNRTPDDHDLPMG